MSDIDKDLDDMGALWQSQPVDLPDLEQLRREAVSRGRRLLALSALDVVGVLVAAGVVVRYIATHPGSGFRNAVVLSMLALAVAFAAWTIANRRGLWRDAGQGPDALVQLEFKRAQASLRFWRMNTRVMLVLGVAVCVAALAQFGGWLGAPKIGHWWMVAAVNLPLVALSIGIERWRSARLRERLQRLQVLVEQLSR